MRGAALPSSGRGVGRGVSGGGGLQGARAGQHGDSKTRKTLALTLPHMPPSSPSTCRVIIGTDPRLLWEMLYLF